MRRLFKGRALVTASLGASIGLPMMIAGPMACRGSSTASGKQPAIDLRISSSTQGEIGKQFTCDGADRSPALSWTSPPQGTRSLALIVIDKDAPSGSFVHWVLYDIPPDARGVSEGLSQQARLPDGECQGRNNFDKIGYGGPCPPGKSSHRYVFTIYALDSKPNLPPGATAKQVMQAITTHNLAQGKIVERYQR